nr:MAG TPA: hypothetical protein [Bacteriophage sp.]
MRYNGAYSPYKAFCMQGIKVICLGHCKPFAGLYRGIVERLGHN